MKSIPVSDLRQRVAEVIADLQGADEPTVVLQRSRKAAYLVSPAVYERDQEELRRLRRALFLAEVREAEAEHAAGATRRFENVEELLDELHA
jgi:PHD/YefM family antitoxin component YafN of YafNO toxin-antitoxin module